MQDIEWCAKVRERERERRCFYLLVPSKLSKLTDEAEQSRLDKYNIDLSMPDILELGLVNY